MADFCLTLLALALLAVMVRYAARAASFLAMTVLGAAVLLALNALLPHIGLVPIHVNLITALLVGIFHVPGLILAELFAIFF